MKYFYGMRLRGFAPGCQPMKNLSFCLDEDEEKETQFNKDGRYHNILCYSKALTENEMRDYELDYIGRQC